MAMMSPQEQTWARWGHLRAYSKCLEILRTRMMFAEQTGELSEVQAALLGVIDAVKDEITKAERVFYEARRDGRAPYIAEDNT